MGSPQTAVGESASRSPTLEALHALKRRLAAIGRRDDSSPAARWLEVAALDAEVQGLRVWELPPAHEAASAEFLRQLDDEVAAASARLGAAERESLRTWIELLQKRTRLLDHARQLASDPELDAEAAPLTVEAAVARRDASIAHLEQLRAEELPRFPRHWRAHALLPGAGKPTREAALAAMQDLASRELPVAPRYPLQPSARTVTIARFVAFAAAASLIFPFKLRLLAGLQIAAIVAALIAASFFLGSLASRARRVERITYTDYESALTDYMNTVHRVVAWDADLRNRMRAEERRQETLQRLAAALQAANDFDATLEEGVKLASFERARPELVESVAALAAAMTRHTAAKRSG